MDWQAGQIWFVAATLPGLVFGTLHVLATVVDTVRPTYFAPTDRAVLPAMEGTRIRLAHARPSLWRIWLGIHFSHGLGIVAFALVCLLVALEDYALVDSVGGLRALTIAVPAVYAAVSLRFWFWGPHLICLSTLLCFAVSAVVS